MAEIDLQPTEEMASNARRGLELRKKHGKGGTAIGVARARDISNRKHLSPETVRRMHAFFNRHEKNKSGGEDDAGYIAWLLWGGDSGKSWAARKFEQLKDKQENARMERSDQLAAKLMKPVTISNHKAMEKIVDEAIAHAKRVGDDDLLELAEETGHEILALRSRASRPGKRTEFAARLAGHPQRKKILELMYDFAVDTDAKGIIVYDKSDVAAIREVLRKNKISPMVNVSVADDYSGGSYHARPGAKAAMDNSQKIIDRYNELKSQPKAKVFDLWKSKIQRGRVSIGEQKISEWDKGSLISDIVRAEFGDRAVDAAFKSSRHGAKAKMGSSYAGYVFELNRLTDTKPKSEWYATADAWLKRIRATEDEAAIKNAERAYDSVEREARQRWAANPKYVLRHGYSRPGAKAKMAMSANEKAMLVAHYNALTKLLKEARSRLFAAERAQDEAERLKAIKDIQQYSAQRDAATAALEREGMMSRPGAKAKVTK
jgi:hypothetical protein